MYTSNSIHMYKDERLSHCQEQSVISTESTTFKEVQCLQFSEVRTKG